MSHADCLIHFLKGCQEPFVLPWMLQPEKDVLEPHGANGAPSNNGYTASDEPSHIADPHSGGLSSSGAAILTPASSHKHNLCMTRTSCMRHSPLQGSTAQGHDAGVCQHTSVISTRSRICCVSRCDWLACRSGLHRTAA